MLEMYNFSVLSVLVYNVVLKSVVWNVRVFICWAH